MQVSRVALIVSLLAATAGVESAVGQRNAADQIDRALLAAPASLRDEATVLGYGGEARAGDVLTLLKQGSNDLVCLADDPDRDGFHVACYHASLDPYMRIGRRLTAAGESRSAILAARFAALEDGRIQAPAAALWSLTAPTDVNPAVDLPAGARKLAVVYVPYAEARHMGLPTRPDGDSPWLMLPGTPWAHVMIPR